MTSVSAIARDAGFDASHCRLLPRRHEDLVEHYVVDAGETKYFLKAARPGQRQRQAFVRAVIGSPGLERQIAVHRWLGERSFRAFKFPRLLRSDGANYLLFEFVAGEVSEEVGFDHDGLVAALQEFQFAGAFHPPRSIGGLLLNLKLNPTISSCQRAIVAIRRAVGVRVAGRCLQVIMDCHRRQQRQPIPVLVHNDFHPDNILVTADGQLFVTDFENVTTTKKWLLLDIVHFALRTQAASIDSDLINAYIRRAHALARLAAIDMEAQLRFALLKRVMQHITSARTSAGARQFYADFLERVLLDDQAFELWHLEHVAEAGHWPS